MVVSRIGPIRFLLCYMLSNPA